MLKALNDIGLHPVRHGRPVKGRAFGANPVRRDGNQVLHSFVLDIGTDVLEDRLIGNLNPVDLFGYGPSFDGSNVALPGHSMVSPDLFHPFGTDEF